MSHTPKSPPARMRNYRIEAELRENPDLHKLAQLFIGMALTRADAERAKQRSPSPRRESAGEVGS